MPAGRCRPSPSERSDRPASSSINPSVRSTPFRIISFPIFSGGTGIPLKIEFRFRLRRHQSFAEVGDGGRAGAGGASGWNSARNTAWSSSFRASEGKWCRSSRNAAERHRRPGRRRPIEPADDNQRVLANIENRRNRIDDSSRQSRSQHPGSPGIGACAADSHGRFRHRKSPAPARSGPGARASVSAFSWRSRPAACNPRAASAGRSDGILGRRTWRTRRFGCQAAA